MSDRATWSGTNLRDYRLIPSYTLLDMLDFIIEGKRGGDFMQALFQDKLSKTFQYADEPNIRALWAIATWIYNRAPETCQREGYATWKGLRSMFVGTKEQVDEVINEWRANAVKGTVLE